MQYKNIWSLEPDVPSPVPRKMLRPKPKRAKLDPEVHNQGPHTHKPTAINPLKTIVIPSTSNP